MLKQRLQDEMKAAMKGGNKQRLGVIRLMLAAVKQKEVDDRVELSDEQVLAVLDKMVKQRRDSITQYEGAGRNELADQEKFEIGVIVDEAISSTGAASIRDMGKVMGIVKPKAQGRADMGAVSALVKERLSS